MHCRNYVLLFILSLQIIPEIETCAQEADTTAIILDEIRVNDSRLDNFTTGEKVETVPDEKLAVSEADNLTGLLARYSAVNIRSYGASGLSTASVRGTGSSHTAVFWEGINLQSPVNGELDLTLVPVSFVDEVSLQYGGAGSLYGSGTLGGAIHLSNVPDRLQNGFGGRIFQQTGSFGSRYTGVNFHFRHRQVLTQTRLFSRRADNDFEYYNRFTARHETQENAGIDQQGILSEVYLIMNKNRQLSLKYWYQDNIVEIPKSASEGLRSRATQADEFHRAVLKYKSGQDNRHLNVQTAVVSHHLNYDNRVNITSSSKSLSWITEVEASYRLHRNWWIDAGVNSAFERADVDGHAGVKPSRSRTAVYASSKMLLADRLEVALGVRESYNDGELSPFLPSLGLNYALSPDIQLKSKVARSFRLPTFNNLYWKSAGSEGNPDIRPELGWSSELGLRTEKKLNDISLWAEATAFSNYISQWIQWIPIRSSVWTPVNVEEVWARGLELNGSFVYRASDSWRLRFFTMYSYTRSTKEAIGEDGNPAELGKQVIYTPVHQWKSALDIIWKNLNLGYSYLFVGEQFIKGDNTRALPHYGISDVSLSWKLRIGQKHQLNVLARANNIMDIQYEVRNARPMPGRNYNIGLAYKFN